MTMMMNVARFEQEPEEQIDEATVGGADEDDLAILDENTSLKMQNLKWEM